MQAVQRVASGLELLGMLLLSTAAGVVTAQHFGVPAGLVVAALVCFVWSALLHVGLRRVQQRELADRRRVMQRTGALS